MYLFYLKKAACSPTALVWESKTSCTGGQKGLGDSLATVSLNLTCAVLFL